MASLRTAARAVRKHLTQSGIIASHPSVLNVFTTDRCNFSCYYCSRNVEDDAPGIENRYEDKSEFHYDDLIVLLDRFPSITEVSFVGIGEPFLIRDLIPMAKLCRERGKQTFVITNGSLLHRHWGEIARAFDQVSISLHGLTPEELVKIASVKEKMFSQFEENIDLLVREESKLNPSMRIRASIVLLKDQLDQVRRGAEFCIKHGIPELDLQNYLPYGLDDSDQCLFDDDLGAIEMITGIAAEFSGRVRINLPVLIKREDEELSWGCTSFFSVLRVDGIGQVSGCNRIMVPKPENGNAKTDPDVWNNEYFKDMRKRFRLRQNLPACCRFCPEAQ